MTLVITTRKQHIFGRIVIFMLLIAHWNLSFTQNWVQQNSGTTKELRDVHFINENTGWAVGSDKTFLKTTDGGDNWTSIAIPFGASDLNLYSVHFIDENKGWVTGAEDFIVRTVDGGNSWINDQSLPGGTPIQGGRYVTDIQFINNNVGWLSATYDIYKTVNGGSTWSVVCTNCSDSWTIWDIHFTDASNGWAITQLNEIYRTTNGGASWTLTPDNGFTLQSIVSKIHFINANTGWFVLGSVSDGTVGKTNNGGNSWSAQEFSRGLYDGDIDFIDANYGWVLGNGVYHTTDGGINWQLQALSVAGISIDFIDRTNGWTVGRNGKIWHFECSIPPTTIDTIICPGASLQVANVEHTESGHYEYVLEGTYGCDSMIILDLSVLPAQATAGADATVCTPETQLLALPPAFPGVSGAWSTLNSPATIQSPDNAQTAVDKLGVGENTFFWTLSHPNCPAYDRDTVVLTFPSLPEADAGSDVTVCLPEAELDALLAPAPITGKWISDLAGPEFSDPSDPFATISNLTPGSDHRLSWVLSHPDCPDYSSSDVIVSYDDGVLEAENDLYFYSSEPLQVNILQNDQVPNRSVVEVTIVGNTNENIGQLELDDQGDMIFTLSEPTIAYSRTFRYRITHNACPYVSAEAEVTIDFTNSEEEPVGKEISLVFTPDGDGINDHFIIPELLENPEEFPNNSLVVINRWGEVVFQAEPYNNDWDGRHYKTGKNLPVGTYFFIARLHLADGIIQQGKATLVR